MTDKEKLKKLFRLWVDWNSKEITGDRFAAEFHALFKKETLAKWNDPLRKLLV